MFRYFRNYFANKKSTLLGALAISYDRNKTKKMFTLTPQKYKKTFYKKFQNPFIYKGSCNILEPTKKKKITDLKLLFVSFVLFSRCKNTAEAVGSRNGNLPPPKPINEKSMKVAELKIYGDITSPEWIWSENDVTFHDVNDFLAANYDAEEIKLRIDCRGGDVDEGWKIYDALRTSGKIISAVIDGECSSMASIILLAAAKERRTMKEHSFILIHNPYTFMFPEPQQAETLQTIADELFAERERFVNLYVERTNATREEIIDLMQKAGKINADEAKRLGFVSGIIPANTAKNTNNQTKRSMKLSFKVRAALVSALGGRVLGMELTTANGETLTVDREEGEIAVGDAATPDGEHSLPDGRVVVVSNGVITEIREATPTDDKDAEIERLKKEVADKDAEIERLKKELEDAKQTDEEKIIVEALKEIGVENIKAMASNAKMPRRNNNKAEKSLREKINEKKGE